MELKNIPSLCRDLAIAEAALHHSNNNYINLSSTMAAGINQITSNKLDQSFSNHPYHEDHIFDHDRNHSGLHDHNNIIIPGLETPERSNTMSGYHINQNHQNMNQLMMSVNHWQTWGSDLELKASPKVSHYDVMRTQWRSCNNLISDCLTPNQGSSCY